MEAIEGLYTELYLGPAEPDLQVWRVQTVLAGGADTVYVCRYPEGAATLRCLAAELGTVDGETVATGQLGKPQTRSIKVVTKRPATECLSHDHRSNGHLRQQLALGRKGAGVVVADDSAHRARAALSQIRVS